MAPDADESDADSVIGAGSAGSSEHVGRDEGGQGDTRGGDAKKRPSGEGVFRRGPVGRGAGEYG